MRSRFTTLFGLTLALGLAWASPSFATKFSPLLADPKFRETDPVPSPDGKWLALQSNRSGPSQLWLMSTQGGQLRQLTAEPESSPVAGHAKIATRVIIPNSAPRGKTRL